MTTQPHDYDVIIVGLGPVGAVLGNLLGAAGVRTAIFEREGEIVPLPRAIGFDGEVMRVIQALGLSETIAPLLRPSPGAQVLDPAGDTIFSRPFAGMEGPQGWPTHNAFHQPQLEQELRAGLDRYPWVATYLRHDVYAVDEKPGSNAPDGTICVRVEDTTTGVLRTVTARFVVGCDGARSLVRRLIGGGISDLGLHEPWVVVDFSLKRDVPALPEITTQFCHPTSPVTYVLGTERRRRFEFKLAPGQDLRLAAGTDNVWALASRWLRPSDAVIERAALYTFHSLIAEAWRRGPMIIAGDSAHQTPPFMGQGLCAGVRDAANLAWRLVRILHHGAPQVLLASYGSERIPHVEAFIAAAVRMGRIFSGGSAQEMHTMADAEPTRGSGRMPSPTPMLGPGLHNGSPGAGQIFEQPRLGDGRRLDDAIGYKFALIGDPSALAAIATPLLDRLAAADVVVVPAGIGAVAAKLAELERPLVLLRPDRYIAASLELTELQAVLDWLWPLICDAAEAAAAPIQTKDARV